MTDFNALLNKSKEKKAEQAEQPAQAPAKSNPFAALNKTVAATKAKTASVPIAPKPAKLEAELQQPSNVITADEFNTPEQPDGLDPDAVSELQTCLETLRNSFEHKEMVADAIRGVLIHLKKHEFLKDILLPEDCQTMVRALRESYGVQVVTKQGRQTKRAASQKDVDEAESLLADLGL